MLTVSVLGAVDAVLEQQYNTLKSMLNRLAAAVDYDMGGYPVIPANVNDPKLRAANLPVKKLVVEWPTLEYSTWKTAWTVFAKMLGWFGPKAVFPLGVYTQLADIFALPKLSAAIEPLEDLIFEVEAAYGEQIGLTTLPTPRPPKPAPGAAPGGQTEPKKPLLSKWAIAGLVAAAAVGGGILYYYRTSEAPKEPKEPTRVNPAHASQRETRPSRPPRRAYSAKY